MIRVVVVAPYASVRSGLRAMVERAEGLEAAGEAASVSREGDAPFGPDVLLVDFLPEGQPSDRYPLVALVEGKEDLPRLAGRPQPWAALPKDAEADEIVAAVRAGGGGAGRRRARVLARLRDHNQKRRRRALDATRAGRC